MSVEAAKTKGMTLIEMAVMIVVLGLAIPPLLTMWADVAWRASRAEALSEATFHAQSLMEEIKSKRFDERTSPPWTDSANFGPDPGESSANKNTFDDVDDFVGATDTAVTAPQAGYIRSVAVEYVTLGAGAWGACGAVLCQNNSDCTVCNACCYKRITVSVSRPDNLINTVTLVTMMSSY